MAIGVKISGTGSYLPDKILTNKDLEKFVDTSDEWITTRTGIKERRIASDTQSTSDLASAAAIDAMSDAGIKNEDVDLIIVATISPDAFFPSTGRLCEKAQRNPYQRGCLAPKVIRTMARCIPRKSI